VVGPVVEFSAGLDLADPTEEASFRGGVERVFMAPPGAANTAPETFFLEPVAVLATWAVL
jgi:hypothetical protein